MRGFFARTLATAGLLLGAVACNSPSEPPLTVAAASDLQPILDPMLAKFTSEGGGKVDVTYGSSGQLAKQITEGAPFDVFFSADRSKAEMAAPTAEMTTYALGRLVVWVPGGDSDPELADLTDPKFVHIAIANPDHAPYGKIAKEALTAAGEWDAIASRVVLGESASDTMRLATSGNADAALVPRTLAIANGTGRWSDVDPALHASLEQTAVVIAAGDRGRRAQQIVALLTGTDGRTALQAGGLDVPAG